MKVEAIRQATEGSKEARNTRHDQSQNLAGQLAQHRQEGKV